MTVTAASLASGAENEGYGTSLSFDITSVSAPANSVLALWLAAAPNVAPSVSGLSLTWSTYEYSTYSSGNLYLVTATVGGTAVSGGTITVSYTGAQPAVGWDLDCISGDDGETPALGITASGAVTAENSTDSSTDVTVTIGSGPVFYLFGSTAFSPSYSGAPGESPAWTELARVFPTTQSPLYWALGFSSQVSADASNPVAKADWGWPGSGYWIAIGVPVSG